MRWVRFSLAFAATLGAALFAAAIAVSPCRAHHGLIAALVLVYDFLGKRVEWLGALNMGALRALNLCTGLVLARAAGDVDPVLQRALLLAALFYLVSRKALSRVVLDLSGRPFLVWNVDFAASKIGSFDTELVREFFTAFAVNGGITLHVDQIHGFNNHHIAEAAFKAVARALRDALETDPRKADAVPSTKGTL